MTDVKGKFADVSKQCCELSVHSQDVSTSNEMSTNDDNVMHMNADQDGVNNKGKLTESSKELLPAYKNDLHPLSYFILDEKTIISYICATVTSWESFADGSHIDATSIVSAREVGDGNLNLVFILYDKSGSSVAVIKQALPYVRCVGTSWPMSITRNHMEAITLQVHYKYCPEYTEKLLFHDPAMGVMVLEDLSKYIIWRRELCQCRFHSYVASQLATYLAQVHFHTSDFYATSGVKKHAVQQVTNVELCENTETLFFTEPYITSQRNNYEDELESVIQHCLRDDAELHLCVAHLKQSFMTHAEAHLHGDIHTGSVFVNNATVKVIDAEFGFYGPLGFDIGNVIGSLLLNYVALPSLLKQRKHTSGTDNIDSKVATANTTVTTTTAIECTTQDLLLSSMVEFWNVYATLFTTLADAETRDVTFGFDGYCKAFLRHVWTESIGYTGTELIRRIVGLSHVIDVDGITERADRVSVKEACIKLGCYLIKHAPEFDTPEDLVRAIINKTPK